MKFQGSILPGRRVLRRHWLARFATRLFLAVAIVSFAGAASAEEDDIFDMDIEDLFNMEVTSLTKSAHALSETPAAIFVITQEDIRRSGLRSIPEMLRMVPGLQVARLSGNRWAISARGFNSLFADKMLVVIDGRSVYTPLYAGTYWDTLDTMIEDIDRIEVIRGPGGTLWGANAVNGVINIVTKKASDTQGSLVSGGGGNVDQGFASARYGAKYNDDLHYRGYFKYNKRDDFTDLAPGVTSNDSTQAFRGGFRMDWELTDNDSLTVQGDGYGGDSNATATAVLTPGAVLRPTTTEVTGGNILANYVHTFSDDQEIAARFYYDRTRRDDVVWDEERDTWDLDLQHRFTAPYQTDVTWGAQYRFTNDNVKQGFETSFVPPSRGLNLVTGFLQLQTSQLDDKLLLMAGSKFIYNDFTGFEAQPSVRASYTPIEKHTGWLSYTRAVRTPSRSTSDMFVVSTGVPVLGGNPNAKSEVVNAFEFGYRLEPMKSLQVDLAAYYNLYEDLLSLEPPPLPAVLPFNWKNLMEGSGYGIEAAINWQVIEWWRLQMGYTWTRLDLKAPNSGSAALAGVGVAIGHTGIENAAPEHQASIRSTINLPANFEFDTAYYYVGAVSFFNISDYNRLDFRLGWKPLDYLELSFAAQNVAQDDHQEWSYEFEYLGTRVPRSYYGLVTIRH